MYLQLAILGRGGVCLKTVSALRLPNFCRWPGLGVPPNSAPIWGREKTPTWRQPSSGGSSSFSLAPSLFKVLVVILTPTPKLKSQLQ